MSTRAMISIDDEFFIYVHGDGYIKGGLGEKLINQFSNTQVTNGLSGDTSNKANGWGCFGAQVVALLKQRPGGVYLSDNRQKWSCDYLYKFTLVNEVLYLGIDDRVNEGIVFSGPIKDALGWLNNLEDLELESCL